MRLGSHIARSLLAAIVFAFALSAAHAAVHEISPPGSEPALHGVACDDAHAEPSCPVCYGKAPNRTLLRGTPIGAEPTRPSERHLHVPGTEAPCAIRSVRPEAARAPPSSS